MTFSELLSALSAGLDGNRFEAEYIIDGVFNLRRGEIALSAGSREVPPDGAAAAFSAMRRRKAGEPLQYIFRRAWFMNLELEVGPDVLIPRPETELLVEFAAENARLNARVLDVGTGSGAIALGLFDLRRDLKVTAVDVSPAALAVARRNRDRCGFTGVELLESDLFSALDKERVFDIVTANLPYVSEEELADCPAEVRDFEPRLALTAPESGLRLIRLAVERAPQFIASGGMLILEIGETQSAAVSGFMTAAGFGAVGVIADCNGRPRIVHGKKA
ncbi:MAG: peptide chain release factor N(5)-glutamine methyltransferase [Victivallaceae bacterium]|nr:peptide chain release factor N(5)-glutamine methyltransferase [Victivallaceae bacterium]